MVNNFDPLVPASYQEWMEGINQEFPDRRILAMMNVTGILEWSQSGESQLQKTQNQDRLAWIAGCAEVIPETELDLTLILNSDADLLENIIITSDAEPPCYSNPEGTMEILQQKNGYLKMEVRLNPDEGGWIFWSQSWYPGWRYRVDGKMAGQTYRANYLFQAAYMPPGATQMEFIYRPASLIWGSVITGVSLLLSVGLITIRGKRKQAN